MQPIHLVHAIRRNAQQFQQQPALRHQVAGQWCDISWADFQAQIDTLSLALLRAGFGVQDKIAIFAQNMPRWSIADFAAQQIRALAVPIFATSTPNQVSYILRDAEVKILFVGSQTELDIALQAVENTPNLTKSGLQKIVTIKPLVHHSPLVCSWDAFVHLDERERVPLEAELQARLAALSFSDLFTLIYTSGTTGEPKGVMLDFANIAHQLWAHDQALHPIDQHDVSLSFLPLSHIFERAWVAYILYRGAVNAYLEDTNHIKEALTAVRPTYMCAVPRFYEKVYSAVHAKVQHAPWLRRRIFHFAQQQGEARQKAVAQGSAVSWWAQRKYSLADKLVLGKLRALLGGRMKMMACGGAKLAPEIGQFFHHLGVNVKLGYGMTETTATISCWQDSGFDPNSIGQIMPGTEVKIGENNEILVKGGGVMRGYYKRRHETLAAFTADGFLKTGDAGQLDSAGNLHITDRIKELMKTSNGKYIAPQVLEGRIGKDHFVEQIAIIADAKKYVSALIVPRFESLEEYAKQLNIRYHDKLELLKHSKIIELFETRIHDLQKELPSFEQIKKFTLLPEAFSIKMEEITPTLKLRRKVIMQRYQSVIEAMYR